MDRLARISDQDLRNLQRNPAPPLRRFLRQKYGLGPADVLHEDGSITWTELS